jgi:outer membrane protein
MNKYRTFARYLQDQRYLRLAVCMATLLPLLVPAQAAFASSQPAEGALRPSWSQHLAPPLMAETDISQGKPAAEKAGSKQPTDCTEVVGVPPRPLLLAEAIHAALCRNPDTRVVWEEALASAAQVGVSRASYYPGVSLVNTLTNERSNISEFPKPEHTEMNEPALTLQYLIYDFGGRAASLDAAKQTALASLFTYYNKVQTVVINTVQSYYSLQSAMAAVRAGEQTLAYNKLAQTIADTKHRLGTAAIADKLQADVTVAQTELNLETLRQQVELQHGALARAMGVIPQTPLVLPEEVPPVLDDIIANSRIDDLIRDALRNRPDLLAAQKNELAARAELEHAKTLDYPTLSLTLTGDNIESRRPVNFNETDSIALLSVNLPLFTGFSNTYQRIQARHNLEAQIATRQQVEQNVAQDVWNSYQNYRTARASVPLANDLLTSAKKSNEVALGRYREGVGTMLDVVNAQAQLANALLSQVNARYAVQMQRANLALAMGLLYQSPDQPSARIP